MERLRVPAVESAAAAESRTIPARWTGWRLPLAAALLLTTVGGAAIWYRTGAVPPPAAPASSAPLSIAVLPLTNESGGPDTDYFSDGLSEELIGALAQIDDLRVIGRASSFKFKNSPEDPRAIGKLLNVTHLLEGSVRRNGRRAHVFAELIDAGDDVHLWSQTYDRDVRDLFEVQFEIARGVAAALKLAHSGVAAPFPTGSVAAHDAYDSFFLPYKSDPRFAAFCRRSGLPPKTSDQGCQQLKHRH